MLKKILDSRFWRMVFVAILVLAFYFTMKRCTKQHKEIAQTSAVIELQHDTVDTYKDAFNRAHAQVQTLQVNIENISQAAQVSIDSLSKELKVAKKNMTSVSSFETSSHQDVKTIVTPSSDTAAQYFDFTYNDKWASITGRIGKKDSSLHYSFSDHIIASSFTKRSWFLGAKKIYFDAYSENPNTKVIGLENLIAPIKMPGRFGVGPYVGLSYQDGKWQPSFGLSVHYSVIRF